MRLLAKLLPVLLLLAAVLQPSIVHAEGDKMPSERTISISATGTVAAKPDLVDITIGVESDGKTAKAALAANTAAMGPVIATLKATGIEPRDIQTSNFSVQPNYEFSQDGKPPKLTGYRVANTVTVRLRSVDKLGDVLDRVVDKGSNQVNGIQFTVSNAEDLKDAARKAAVGSATRMAKAYAQAAGIELGPVLLINEGASPREIGPALARRALQASAAAPIEAGEQQLDVLVTMVWAIK